MNTTRIFALLLASSAATRGEVFSTPAPTPAPTVPGSCLSAGTYEGVDWADMPEMAQAAATVLGYDQGIWDLGGYSILQATYWEWLTSDERDAATVMGCAQECWDWCD